MSSKSPSQTSETTLIHEIFKLSDAGGSVIQIRTRESWRTALALRKAILSEETNYAYSEWDPINGVRAGFSLDNYSNHLLEGASAGKDIYEALMAPLNALRKGDSTLTLNPDKIHFFVYIDAHPLMRGNPMINSLLQQYATILPSKNACLIFVTPHVSFDDLPIGTMLVTDMPTPTAEELAASLGGILEGSGSDFEEEHDLDGEDMDRIALLGLGLTRFEFETHAALAIVQASIDGDERITYEALEAGIAVGKTEVVKQSQILELFPNEDMADVGGMQRLKDWLDERVDTFSPEAREFGVRAPKGIAIVGVPGAGKSLIAKAIGGAWGIPVIRLDFGKVFSKFVGESEANMRQALNMISRMGRLVLFADEIDKGLAGSGGGGNDSGISSRVLGAFLTWMQENESEVFVVMTANRIEGLPPELFRRGRLDAVFSVGLPNEQERVQVLDVHLRKRGRDIKDFTASELTLFKAKSEGYVPAEIESAVKDGLIIAYNDKSMKPGERKLKINHIVQVLENMVPMSVSHETQINAIVEWAKNNATPVNYDNVKPVLEVTESGTATRRSPRARANRVTH
jgi:AAA+ superfamily predicted ATPase